MAPEWRHVVDSQHQTPPPSERPYVGPHSPWRSHQIKHEPNSSGSDDAFSPYHEAFVIQVHFPQLEPEDMERLGLIHPGAKWLGRDCNSLRLVLEDERGDIPPSDITAACMETLEANGTFSAEAAALTDWPDSLEAARREAASIGLGGGRSADVGAATGSTCPVHLVHDHGSLLVLSCRQVWTERGVCASRNGFASGGRVKMAIRISTTEAWYNISVVLVKGRSSECHTPPLLPSLEG